LNLRSTLAQAATDALSRLPADRRLRLAVWLLLKWWRRRLSRLGDPLVRYRLGGTDLLIPVSHELPEHRAAYPQYSANLGRIGRLVSQKYDGLVCVDIGANVGDSLAILREQASFPILCVEGNPRYFELLRRNVSRDVALDQAYVGNTSGSVTVDVIESSGTARLVEVREGTKVQMSTLADVLARHPQFARPKLLKIDTDGMDSLILLGAAEMLADVRPVVFFEFDPDSSIGDGDLFATLRAAGYERVIVYENTGEYLLTATLDDLPLLADLTAFYSGRRSARYADMCVFHGEDRDLCAAIRQSEIAFFAELRRRNALSNHQRAPLQ